MIEKVVSFSRLEVTESGVIQIRLEKQIVENGAVIAREYHRTCLEPGTPIDAQMAAVNEHLAAMGYPAPAAEVIERVRKVVNVEHTTERVAKFKADRARFTAKSGGGPGEEK